jgi:hypothetical protein
MPDVPLDFSWEIAASGYRWLHTHAIDQEVRGHYLVANRPTGAAASRVCRYQPLIKFSGLFLQFAELEPNLDAIAAFANAFGHLGPPLAKPVVLYDRAKGDRAPVAPGEHIGAWTKEILIMRLTAQLWEAARKGDTAYLSRMIFWETDGSGVRIDTHPDLQLDNLPPPPFHVDKAWIAASHLGDDVLGRFIPGDLIKPAFHRVQTHVNEQLRHRASPRLLWDPQRERLGLYIVPEGLIGALWVQLARAIERDSRFRRCGECGTWFELAPDTARSDKRYCSTPCRTKAYRRRQAEAVRLDSEGRSVEEIAQKLQSEPETVRGWIEKTRSASGSSPAGAT